MRLPITAAVLLAIAAPAAAKKPPAGYEPALPQPAAPAPHSADGAIFNASAGYAPLVTGARAHAVGDVLTINLVETTTTAKTASSKTQRAGSGSVTPPTAGPFAIDPNALNAAAQSSFNGQGQAAQTSSFSGTVSVTIAEVRANGTALVRGEKRMMLSQGQEWIQFSGIVRLADIDPDNAVASGKVADARVEYAGNGAIQRSAREGWLSKFFNLVSPF
ncbi:MAG: flagellar basal body L-ring protein FlgH [Proteobacteria bacterium]|nr:flagellar basal body L-ring protein FlgH [Pseudomonadota bacterium]